MEEVEGRNSRRGSLSRIPEAKGESEGEDAKPSENDEEEENEESYKKEEIIRKDSAKSFTSISLDRIHLEAEDILSIAGSIKSSTRSVSIASSSRKPRPTRTKEDPKVAVNIMFMLATAFSANLGGTAFPTGTGPNLVLWGLLER